MVIFIVGGLVPNSSHVSRLILSRTDDEIGAMCLLIVYAVMSGDISCVLVTADLTKGNQSSQILLGK